MTGSGTTSPRDPQPAAMTNSEAFSRERWAALGDPTFVDLSGPDVERLVATGEPVSLEEVRDVYVPLSQFLALLAGITRTAHERIDTFLAASPTVTPFIVGIAGSVAVGKSTTGRSARPLSCSRRTGSCTPTSSSSGAA